MLLKIAKTFHDQANTAMFVPGFAVYVRYMPSCHLWCPWWDRLASVGLLNLLWLWDDYCAVCRGFWMDSQTHNKHVHSMSLINKHEWVDSHMFRELVSIIMHHFGGQRGYRPPQFLLHWTDTYHHIMSINNPMFRTYQSQKHAFLIRINVWSGYVNYKFHRR